MQLHSETHRWVPSVRNAFFKMTQRAVHIGVPFSLWKVVLEDAKRNPSLRPLVFMGTARDGKPFVERTTISTKVPSFTELWQDSTQTAFLSLSIVFVELLKAPFTIITITADPVEKSDPEEIRWRHDPNDVSNRSLWRLFNFTGKVWLNGKWTTYRAVVGVFALEITNKRGERRSAYGWDFGLGTKIEVGRKHEVIYEF